ncbi:MAG: STAS domain-containing protein [Candidatus Eisenbacteria bacterium]|uniref:STAS domain-containing protein n=1 Tax=Eiseniibacteriota bacterium TaxID=2212470 RepID=A0A948RZK1_UNCEI|nr:STAS domain-containing protein [Candidatus Eisenbacteria bacterium]MBU1949517.1 STAS domain-containing protein [Candidatus Eisenbacteria bacterium]MBU2692548.1 STAS domain-containing protein [Candidatus Eisenbacteria bacterium]
MSSWEKLEVERIEHEDPEAVVYRLSGVLTDRKDCFDFLDTLRQDVRRGGSCLIINLEKCEHVTSAGVGILAASYTSVTNAGGRMCLVGASNRVLTLLKLVGLLSVMNHYTLELEAFNGMKD